MNTPHLLIHAFLALAMPLLLLGVINKTKAAFAGRVGPPLLQPYYDVSKLLRKGSVFSATTTWVFRAGPVVGLVTALAAATLMPMGGHPALVSFEGDLVLFAYLFGLGRFFTVAAALDTGSAFEGMGGAREATFSCLAEPALFFAMVVLTRFSGSLSLSAMLGPGLGEVWSQGGASLVLVGLSLFIVLLAENCRIPVDDPNTHLELTMIHEVMVLDHSGPALGLIHYGAAVKLFVLGAIVVRISTPNSADPWVGWGVFVAGMLLLAIAIGVVESVMARLRMAQVPVLLVAACLLSAFGIVLVAR
ncbi:MAG TPA: NADH-quinone oxidoreductase subunit H [Myxococcales bacterium]